MEAPGHRALGAPAAPLYLFAFGSGAAALVYEVAWTKMLALTFGRTTLAASAVVAAFMGGMGIGAWLYHRALGRRFSPLQLYAGLELGIALCTALLTLAFLGLPGLFAFVAGGVPSGLAMDLFRVGFVLLVLLLPAALMGATYPALCTALIRSRDGLARHLGPIYGLNTVGAAVGALIAGVVMIEWLGLRGSVLCANAVNVAIALGAWTLSRREARGAPAPEPDEADAALPTTLPQRVTAIVLFGSGLATLAYEILWFRALRYLFGNSTYAFTVMLVVFLTGLGLGGLLFGRVVRRASPERDLAACQIGIALLAVLAIGAVAILLADQSLEARVSIFYAAVFQMAWWHRLLLEAGVALAMMLPATLLMGLSFPLATRLYLGDVRRLGARVGRATLLANLGSIGGSVLAAVLILPRLGTVGGTRAVAALNLGLGLLVLARISGPARRRLALAATAAIAVGVVAALLPDRLSFRGGGTVEILKGALVFEEEGDLATVQVWANEARPELRAMTIDGTAIGVSAGWNYALYSKQLLLAHLPMALDARIRQTLNVGLGSASTLEALASYPTLETLDVIEISRSVARASAHFAEATVLDDPRARLVVEDVSHFLLRSDRLYDLIISDGKQGSDFSGNSAMLCREFYQNALRRLSPDGLLVQWIPLATPSEDVRITLRTFSEVFPEAEVFMDAPQSMLMVGSRTPIAGRPRFSPDAWRELRARRDLEPLRIPSRDALLGRWVAGRRALRESIGPGPVSTWDRTRFEFSAYKTRPDVWARAPQANLALLLGAHRVALSAGDTPPLPVDSPYVRSTELVRQALLEQGEGRRGAARRLLERALRANPADPRPAWLLGRGDRTDQSRADRAAVRPARS